MGNADVRVAFDKRKHDLNVSTFALVILLLFEDLPNGEFLTYDVSYYPSPPIFNSQCYMICAGNKGSNIH